MRPVAFGLWDRFNGPIMLVSSRFAVAEQKKSLKSSSVKLAARDVAPKLQGYSMASCCQVMSYKVIYVQLGTGHLKMWSSQVDVHPRALCHWAIKRDKMVARCSMELSYGVSLTGPEPQGSWYCHLTGRKS